MKKNILIILILAFTTAQAQFQPDWQSLDAREIPSWWTDAKFGIFIHWGLYSPEFWINNLETFFLDFRIKT